MQSAELSAFEKVL